MGSAPNRPDPKISDILGPQSQQATGKIRLLVIPVRFPDAAPQLNLNQIKTKAVVWLNDYVKDQSYGRSCIEAKMTGWISLPDPLSSYSVSSNNFKVDRDRVRKLIEDAMTGVESKINFPTSSICSLSRAYSRFLIGGMEWFATARTPGCSRALEGIQAT